MINYTSRAVAPTQDEPKLELVQRAPERGTEEHAEWLAQLAREQEARFAREGVPPRVTVHSNTLDRILAKLPFQMDDEEAAAISAPSLADQYGFRDESFDDGGTFTGKRAEPRGRNPHEDFDLEDLLDYNTDNDPNTVLGNRWICRGGSFVLVSQSGIGKSSLTTQLAIGWSSGRTDLTLGIPAIKPLRQLIIQAENDQGDLAEVAKGVVHGFDLSAEDRRNVKPLVRWRRMRGTSGEHFLDQLEEELFECHARGEAVDICWIDPLINFLGGKVDMESATAFTSRLDVIGQELGTIFGIIHHTGKPAKDELKMTATDLAYAGIGSSGLTNWAREIIVVKREHTAKGEPLAAEMTMCKRRLRAGLATMAEDGEGGSGMPTESIYIRHASDGNIRWEQCAKPSSGSQQSGGKQTGGAYRAGKGGGRPGRKSSYSEEHRALVVAAINEHGGRIIPVDALEALSRKLGKSKSTVRTYLEQEVGKTFTDEQRMGIAEAVAANGDSPRLPDAALRDLAGRIVTPEKELRRYLDNVADANETARADLEREGSLPPRPRPEDRADEASAERIAADAAIDAALDAFEEKQAREAEQGKATQPVPQVKAVPAPEVEEEPVQVKAVPVPVRATEYSAPW
jgi:AraC-like DNA-binding protein